MVTLDSEAELVASCEAQGGCGESVSCELLEHRGTLGTVAGDSESVEVAHGDGVGPVPVTHVVCGLVALVGLLGTEGGSDTELVELSEDEHRLGFGSGSLAEVFEHCTVIRCIVRCVVVQQGAVGVKVSHDRGAEVPHGCLLLVRIDDDAVGVAGTDDELGGTVSLLGRHVVPSECLGFVGVGTVTDREPLPELETGTHVSRLGFGNQLL